jgi:P pilus assembly chaperone PapD
MVSVKEEADNPEDEQHRADFHANPPGFRVEKGQETSYFYNSIT